MITYAKQRTSVPSKVLYVILSGLIVVGLGALFGFLGDANKGYTGLVRPTFTPPDIVFSIVWPILYFMIGISFCLSLLSRPVDKESDTLRTISIVVFIVQLAINLAWPIVFFKAESYFIAFIMLAVMDALVTMLVIIDFKVNVASAILLIPYLAWLIFATYLNLMILVYN